jgi:glucose-1-phosphatase
MKKLFLVLASALVLWGCYKDNTPTLQQADWLEHTAGFQDKYELEQLVVLSRHNIRTPMVGKGSILERLTNPAYQWFPWEDPASYLTDKGERLEAHMGAFFHEWLQKQDFIGRYSANPASYRFYANAKQRCQKTARTFADAVLPGSNPEVEMKVAYDTMDPVFNPQITKLSAGFEAKAQQEIASLIGDLNAGATYQFGLIESIIDIANSPAYPDTMSFSQFPSVVGFKLNAEPYMTGGLKMACSVADALVLQYYEEPDARKAAFGHELKDVDWTDVALVVARYQDALFSTYSVAVNVAHPLLQTMLSELQEKDRCFSFLCGHDSNIGSVLASLEAVPYELPQSIEKKVPIGSKIIVEKFKAKDGTEYADLWFVYASTTQLREERKMSYSYPPMAVRLRLNGLKENADGLYLLSDVEQRFSKAIKAYDAI